MPLRLQNKLKSELPEQSAHALLTIFLQNGLKNCGNLALKLNAVFLVIRRFRLPQAENWTSYIVQQFAIFLTIKGTS